MHEVLIIGGGPGGYRAAELAARAGLSTVLFEGNALGGVCLNEGCVPSKTLLNSVKIMEHARDGAAFGVLAENVRLDLPALITRKRKVVKQLTGGVRASVKEAGALIVDSYARILSAAPGRIRVQADGQEYEGRRLVVATGSGPILPPIPGLREALESGAAVTSREILEREVLPQRMTVIGAGVIGLELAGYCRAAGVEVDIVEMTGRIAGNMDLETAAALKKQFERKGIRFHLDTRVTRIGDGRVEMEGPEGALTLEAPLVLLAAGRSPTVGGFGLEQSGVLVERGHIPTDDRCRTNVPGVYAVGDVNGAWMLAHAAYREAETAVSDMTGGNARMRYDAVPSILYTTPEAASVGLTEEQCALRPGGYAKAVVPMGFSGRFLAETSRETGFCKVLADPAENRLLGCHILGPYASEIIVSAGILIESEARLRDLREFVFPHPTVGEVLREAFFRL
ncbi:MAG: FAD-dependent oxidoreductase [Clostridia bacterium]|nr:FAD-dependent oxidoreductase [Clostridia bacterium]